MTGTVLLLLSAGYVCAENNEFAEDLGQAAGSVVGAPGGAAGVASGALLGKYGTRAMNNGASWLIDAYFDAEDQAFADAECVTIRSVDGKVINPSSESGCH